MKGNAASLLAAQLASQAITFDNSMINQSARSKPGVGRGESSNFSDSIISVAINRSISIVLIGLVKGSVSVNEELLVNIYCQVTPGRCKDSGEIEEKKQNRRSECKC